MLCHGVPLRELVTIISWNLRDCLTARMLRSVNGLAFCETRRSDCEGEERREASVGTKEEREVEVRGSKRGEVESEAAVEAAELVQGTVQGVRQREARNARNKGMNARMPA